MSPRRKVIRSGSAGTFLLLTVMLGHVQATAESMYCEEASSSADFEAACDDMQGLNGPAPFDAGYGAGTSSGLASYTWYWNRLSGIMLLDTTTSGAGSAVATAQIENGYTMNTGDLLVDRQATVKAKGYHQGKTFCVGPVGDAAARMDLDVVVSEAGEEINSISVLDLSCSQEVNAAFAREFQVTFKPGKHYGIYVWARCETSSFGLANGYCDFHSSAANAARVQVDLIEKANVPPEAVVAAVENQQWHPEEAVTLSGRACDIDDRIVQVKITAGDGSSPYVTNTNSVCRSEGRAHQYAEPGTYTASFCGTDKAGASTCKSTTFTLTCDLVCEAFRLLGVPPPV